MHVIINTHKQIHDDASQKLTAEVLGKVAFFGSPPQKHISRKIYSLPISAIGLER